MILFVSAGQVDAHATLIEQVPAAQVVTNKAPSVVKLRFNETIQHAFAHITIYDAQGSLVYQAHPNNPDVSSSLLTYQLPTLKEGSYTIKWNVISLDGHPVQGSYVFAVKKASTGGVVAIHDTNNATSILIAIRTIVEGLLLICAGFIWFSWLIRHHSLFHVKQFVNKWKKVIIPILFLGTMGEMVTYIFTLPQGIMPILVKGNWHLLLDFPFLVMVLIQFFMLIMVILPQMVTGWYLAIWFILAAIPAFGGHVWGLEHSYLALIPRILHELSIAIWLGILVYLIICTTAHKKHDEAISWKTLRSFMLRLLLPATIIVIMSGVIMAHIQTGIISIFTDWLTWSWLFVGKVVFTLMMLGLALFQTIKWQKNRKFVTPKLVRLEIGVGMIVLLFGVWMSQAAYPIKVESYHKSLYANNTKADVQMENLQTGNQKMMIKLGESPKKVPDSVSIKLTMPDHDMEAGTYQAKSSNDGNYVVTIPFSMTGTWQFTITVDYKNGDTRKWQDHVFIVQ